MAKMDIRTPRPRRIKLRIMGSETEFGMRFVVPPQKDNRVYAEKMNFAMNIFVQGNYMTTFVRGALPENSQNRFRGLRAIMQNQGQLYVDTNFQIEYATPECLGADELALHETAGLVFIARALKKFNDGYANIMAPIKMYKTNRNTGFVADGARLSEESWGAHANYLTFRRLYFRDFERWWLPFLQTRWCVIGNGWADFFDGQYAHFLFSQRADVMDHRWRHGATDIRKPLIHTRDEPHARSDIWRRLHDISGNANMSQKQIALKYGIADIVLAMIETENFLREPPHFREKKYNANEVCRCFNGDIFGRIHLECEDGGRRGFLDVQEFYIEEALRFFGEGRATLTDERRRALDGWQSVIDAMRRRDVEYLSRFLDWAAILRQLEFLFAKLHLDFELFCGMEEEHGFVHYSEGRGVAWDAPVPRKNSSDTKLLPYLLEYMTQYADVETARSPYGILMARGFMESLFTPEQIAHAALHPPERTRAHLREVIEATVQPPHRILLTKWEEEYIWAKDSSCLFSKTMIPLPNPYRFRIGPDEERILSNIVSDKI